MAGPNQKQALIDSAEWRKLECLPREGSPRPPSTIRGADHSVVPARR